MSSPPYRVRRATLDDIGPLTELWKSMQFPVEDLARRITEFQLVETGVSELVGAVALQVVGRQGLIHSEGFVDFALAEYTRPLLWERLQALAANHGLSRLWTQEQAPFWGWNGLGKPDVEALEKLPKAWGNPSGHWLTLKLREDFDEVLSADKEFALFMASERERSQRALQHARALKVVAALIAFAVLGLVLIGGYLVLIKNPQVLHR